MDVEGGFAWEQVKLVMMQGDDAMSEEEQIKLISEYESEKNAS